MAQIRYNAPGDDFDIDRTISLIPAGDSLSKAWLTVKRTALDLDAAALVQLSITTASTSSGQITDTGVGDTIGAMTLKLTGAQTRIIGATPVYYDIQVRTALGKIFTLETGDIGALNPEFTVVDV